MTQVAQGGRAPMPLWATIATGLGLVWSLFGAVQFIMSLGDTVESLQASGLTAEQAAVMTGYPGWMTAAFAFGTFGGVIGCILLLLRRASALPVLALSLLAYLALYYGDIAHGVFAAMGTPQIVILTLVVAIAAALLWLSVIARRRGWLV
jgi:hypothetical protein